MPPQGGGQDLILGLDGGTTSTVCICMPMFSLTDDYPPPDPPPVLAHAVAGCSNHNSVGETAAKETLERVMEDALFKSGSTRSAVRAVCLAVSGVNHPTDQQRILSWLREIFPNDVKCSVHNETVAACELKLFVRVKCLESIRGLESSRSDEFFEIFFLKISNHERGYQTHWY